MTPLAGRHVILLGGQFGSEGKGRVAEWLLDQGVGTCVVRTGGPQAGHTVSDSRTGGRATYTFRQLPVSLASARADQVIHVIGRTAVVDLQVLFREWSDWEGAGQVWLDPEATILERQHHEREATLDRIGSTRKGIGAARVDRIWRTARRIGDLGWESLPNGLVIRDTSKLLAEQWRQGQILFEGTQGVGLSLHSPYYPHVTSADITATDALAAAGIGAPLLRWRQWLTLGVYRTFPIRVAGRSGPLFQETSFEALGQPTEYTSVTLKPRRIGAWDPKLARWSAWFGGIDWAVLTFLDYLPEPDRLPFVEAAGRTIGVPVYAWADGPGRIHLVEGDPLAQSTV